MEESETPNRQYQFSLKRLLLWTAGIAIYLGLARAMNWDPPTLFQISALVLGIALLRGVAGSEAAAIGSLVGCGVGLLFFLLIECTFLVIDRLDARPARETQTIAPIRQGLSASSEFGLALGALVVGMLGSVIPITILIELWQEPIGAGIRPMNLPLAMFWCGLGTPIVAIWFCLTAVQLRGDSAKRPRQRLILFSIIGMSLVTAFLPLLLTTFAAKWVIQAHSLWIKP